MRRLRSVVSGTPPWPFTGADDGFGATRDQRIEFDHVAAQKISAEHTVDVWPRGRRCWQPRRIAGGANGAHRRPRFVRRLSSPRTHRRH
jgi:hypothetical protein